MTYSIGSSGTAGGFAHHRDHDVEKAIEHRVDSLIETVLWYVSDEGDIDRDRAIEIVSESSHEDTAAIGLTLEQMLEAIDEGMEEYGDTSITLTYHSLRSDLESYAAYFINLLAEGRAREIFDELYDFMEEHDFEPAQMRENDSLGWLPHRSEREEDGCVVFEHRDVEEPGRHIDVWQYPLPRVGRSTSRSVSTRNEP